ncbi:hypothetical protein [Anabaena sp. CCY 9910]|uniref:hypothetical protein n=1 Tax=Anabaena sp. CCY 9910 TaxID=3103870 RepID=UPI0039E0B625
MKVAYKPVLNAIIMGLVIVGAISDKPGLASSVTLEEGAKLEIPTPTVVSQSQGVYRSDRFLFRFTYSSKDFVIDNDISTPSNGIDAPVEALDIWTKQHAQEIRAGAYEGGTEYPANVSIRVYDNPKKLPLQQWVKQSNQFTMSRDFKIARIAGKTGIKFQSSGLYESESVVFINPKDARIIVVSLSKNSTNDDAVYRRAYQQIVNSFIFVNR